MNDGPWEIIHSETTLTQLTLVNHTESIQVIVREDGCINLWIFANGVEDVADDDTCYAHICDVDRLFAALKEAQRRADRHFYGR